MKRLREIHVQVREHSCSCCPTPCASRSTGALNLEDAEASCPLPAPRWGPNLRGASIGLGDLVHAVAHPAAVIIDGMAGTYLQHCDSCRGRQAGLNQAVPDIARPFRRRGHARQPRHAG